MTAIFVVVIVNTKLAYDGCAHDLRSKKGEIFLL